MARFPAPGTLVPVRRVGTRTQSTGVVLAVVSDIPTYPTLVLRRAVGSVAMATGVVAGVVPHTPTPATDMLLGEVPAVVAVATHVTYVVTILGDAGTELAVMLKETALPAGVASLIVVPGTAHETTIRSHEGRVHRPGNEPIPRAR